MRTQVGIVGAGPAGLLLSHLLARQGIESVVLEARSRDYVEQRIRAGVLEHPTVELLREVGLGARMDAQGLPHEGISLRFEDEDHRIDFAALTGRGIVVYGQQEVVKDLIAARLADGAGAGAGDLRFEVSDLAVDGITDDPVITYNRDGRREELHCDVIAGCDGFHGITRGTFAGEVFDRQYPFAWLGILAKAAPIQDELVYANHPNGFALYSMRSPEVTRLYLQVPPDTDASTWSEAQIWDELRLRLGTEINEGPLIEKSVTGMRSFVTEPMRHGKLFLAGDAAHIVPPTGAKGMNLAVADVRILAEALDTYLHKGDETGIDGYSDTCLRRVWRAEHFSWWMTSMLHTFDDEGAFNRRLQLSQLRYTVSSTAAATSLAENYVGLPHGAI